MKVDTKAIEVKMAELGIKTYVDMAKRTGLDRITISNVINNKSKPSPETMDALYRVLELTPEEAGRIFFTEKLTSYVSKDKESVKER